MSTDPTTTEGAGKRSPAAEAEALVERLRIALAEPRRWSRDVRDIDGMTEILELTPATQREVLLRVIADQSQPQTSNVLGTNGYWHRRQLIARLLQRKLPLTDDDLQVVMAWANFDALGGPDGYIIDALERRAREAPLTPELRSAIVAFRSRFVAGRRSNSLMRSRDERVAKLLGEPIDEEMLAVDPAEPWAQRMMDDLSQPGEADEQAFRRLLVHASSARAGKPAKKWLKEAQERLEPLDPKLVRSAFTVWFRAFEQPRAEMPRYWPTSEWYVAEVNADLLKGMAWTASLIADDELMRALNRLTIASQRKIPGVGPRSAKVTNAAIWALSQGESLTAVGQLSVLGTRLKTRPAQQAVAKALDEIAARLGVSADEVAEMAVPAYGPEEVGVRRETMGDYVAELRVTGTDSTELRFLKPDGKPQKSVPAAIRQTHADDIKELKAAAKDIQKMLPAQRERLDALYLQQRSWDLDTWRQRYLDHPLVGVLARRLIWRLTFGDETRDGIWHDGQLMNAADEPLELPNDARVELWHPIGESTERVLGWREWLERHEVRQPFKQAHREVYLLTEAERNTRVYSKRFAAHLLKQHQFNALCAARGWKNRLRLMVDDEYPPASRELLPWNLRAEFWVEGIGEEYGADTNESGVYLYVATDQVRFYPLESAQLHAHASGGGYEWSRWRGDIEPEPIPLEQIPPLVFSEVMRDVDLFVGVASVGNDPNWVDAGTNQPRRAYWEHYSFGDLSATAQTRKDVLERLLPRLKIRDRATLDGRFLKVRGDLRTYKIHLGSGNILMEPNDQYLCIVPKPGSVNAAEGKVFLPFEGDRMLSIILSKAFLLANDRKITDPTITAQIGER